MTFSRGRCGDLLMLSLGEQADFCPDKTTKLPVVLLIYDYMGQNKTHPLNKSSFAETCHSRYVPFSFESIGWTTHSWLEVGFV